MMRLGGNAALAMAFALVLALALAPGALADPQAGGQSGNGGHGADGGNVGHGDEPAGGSGPANGNAGGDGHGNGGGSGNGNAGGNGNGNGNGGGQAGTASASAASDPAAADPGAGNGQGQSGGAGQGNGNAPAGDSPGTPAASTDPPGNAPVESPSSASQAGGNGDTPGGNGPPPGHGPSPGSGHGPPSQAPGQAPGHDDAHGPSFGGDHAGPVAPVPVTDGSPGLRVDAGRAGNVLTWAVPPAAQQVQVWRLESDGWIPVAVVDAAAPGFTDAEAGPMAQYRLTWSSESLGDDGLALAATALPMVSAPESKGLGTWLAVLLWGGVGALGFVRTHTPRRVLETRPGLDHPMAPLLAGLPGVDAQAVERVSALGMRTVAQLRTVDPDTLAFWARIPSTMVRHWKETIDLLIWPGLPAGAGERLALAGHGTLAHLAAAQPGDLTQRLRAQSGVEGPGVPADEGEVAGWIIEARLALGMAAQPSRTAAEATVERAETLRQATSASAA